MEREAFVYGGKSRNEVVFESLDGSFGGVDSMIIRLHQLPSNILGFDEVLDGFEAFVVSNIKLRFALFLIVLHIFRCMLVPCIPSLCFSLV